MFDKDNTNERAEQTARYDNGKKEKPPIPENLVDWADRVIKDAWSGDCISGQKKKSPLLFITILTLTMLFAFWALICIYK